MSNPKQRIDRAIRLTPGVDRGRYAAEWRHDLASAAEHGLAPRDVGRGAMRLAIQLRARQVERVLLGGHGAVVALCSWLALVALLVLSSLLGGIVLLLTTVVLLVLVVVLSRAGTPSHWTHWLMVVSIVTGVASGAFVWWAAVAKVNAADNLTAEPPAAAWGGLALVLFALSALTLLVAGLAAASRERRIRHGADATDTR
jgi:hypothetical protein